MSYFYSNKIILLYPTIGLITIICITDNFNIIELEKIIMGVIRIKKGLDLPINGEPKYVVDESKKVKKVALLGNDYIGLKPTLLVTVGEKVKLGQVFIYR